MDDQADTPPTILRRRRARRLAYWNGAVWAIGNGLASSMLIVYLAMELGVPRIGLAISFILAAPRIAGLLRMAAPLLIGRLGNRKRFCLGMYLASGLVLLGLPFAASPTRAPSPGASLVALVILWCSYHLLEYLGTLAQWSWLADLVPMAVRGRFIGRRERWMVSGQAVAMLSGGLFTWGWHYLHPAFPKWITYAILAVLGACFMIASVVPLFRIPACAASRPASKRESPQQQPGNVDSPPSPFRLPLSLLAPFSDRRFLPLLLFGCWFSTSNGVTQSVQFLYPYRVLGISLFVMLALKTGMRCGQLAISPWVGRLADRLGNRPVMITATAVVALGPLFHYFATPGEWWWLIAAWTVWIAYAGLNVCLPNLILKLSPRESNTAYIGTYYGISGLCIALSTLVGGALFDRFSDVSFVLYHPAFVVDYYQYSFLFGWITRSMSVLFLLLIVERPHKDVSP